MRIEKMGSKTDFAVKLVLVLFITLLSFSIGTFVGKQYSDNQHQLALLEPTGAKSAHAEASREVASVHGEDVGTKSSTMSDEEIAKLAEEFVADETESPAKEANVATHGDSHAEAHGAVAATANEHGTEKASNAGHETPVDTKKSATGHADVHGATATTAANEHRGVSGTATELAGAEKKLAKNRVPSSLPKNVAQYTIGKFTVQVASYTDETEAQKMATDLKKKGYSAFYIPALVKGQTYYRVSVGQFASQKEAQSYRGELMDKAKVSAAIVQKITE